MPLDIDTSTTFVEEEIFLPSTIETIDAALTEFVSGLNIFVSTNEGRKKTPIIWTSAERNFQTKDGKDLRDSNGILIKPVITIERKGISKEYPKKGTIYANIPAIRDYKGGSITISRQINQEKTSNFANADALRKQGQKNFRTRKAQKVVYETITIPMPVYIEVTYNLSLYTEYQQQMNELVTPFLIKPGAVNAVAITKDDHRFEAFIDSNYSAENNLASLGSEERRYQTDIAIRVIGYIIGDDKNQEQPRIVRRQNAVEVKIPRERVIVGDIPTAHSKSFYKE